MIPTWLPDTVTTDVDRIVSRALLWGIEALELRMVGGPMQRVPDVNESRLRRRLEEAELPVVAIVPGLFEGHVADRPSWMDDLERLEESIRFCRRIGCPTITVSAFAAPAPADSSTTVDIFRRAGDRSAKAGIRLGVAHEVGGAYPSALALAELLDVVDHPAVGAALDLSFEAEQEAAVHALASRLVLARVDLMGPHKASREALGVAVAAGFNGPVSLVLRPGTSGKDGLARATEFLGLLRASAQKLTPM